MTPAEMMTQTRKDLGLKQVEMAAVLSVHVKSVSKYERGQLAPSGTVMMVYRELAAGWRPRHLQDLLRKKEAIETLEAELKRMKQ